MRAGIWRGNGDQSDEDDAIHEEGGEDVKLQQT